MRRVVVEEVHVDDDPVSPVARSRLPSLIALGFSSGLTACAFSNDTNFDSFPAATSLSVADRSSDGSGPPVQADEIAVPTGDTVQTLFEAPALSATYLGCAKSAGLDFTGAQVSLSRDGVPQIVKTGVDVPAEIHTRCWDLVGGRSTAGTSSWGYSDASSSTRTTAD